MAEKSAERQPQGDELCDFRPSSFQVPRGEDNVWVPDAPPAGPWWIRSLLRGEAQGTCTWTGCHSERPGLAGSVLQAPSWEALCCRRHGSQQRLSPGPGPGVTPRPSACPWLPDPQPYLSWLACGGCCRKPFSEALPPALNSAGVTRPFVTE